MSDQPISGETAAGLHLQSQAGFFQRESQVRPLAEQQTDEELAERFQLAAERLRRPAEQLLPLEMRGRGQPQGWQQESVAEQLRRRRRVESARLVSYSVGQLSSLSKELLRVIEDAAPLSDSIKQLLRVMTQIQIQIRMQSTESPELGPEFTQELQVQLEDIAHLLRVTAIHAGVPVNRFVRLLAGAGDPPVDSVNAVSDIPVSIYLVDDDIHSVVEKAVEDWLTNSDFSIDTRDKPITGSWFRSMKASMKKAATTPAAREALLTATHVADSHLVQAQDAYVTATLLQNVGPVLQALHPTKDAVVRAGALLIVKVDWTVQVHQLTAAQQAVLDHKPHLAASPHEIITALQLGEPELREPSVPPIPQPVGRGETAAAIERQD